EPVWDKGPIRPFKGHRAEVSSVAVSKDSANPLVVSGSADGTVIVWNPRLPGTGIVRVVQHASPVKVVACAPPGGKRNWCLSGWADGSIRLWDLDSKAATPVKELKDPHRDAVSALAFSPDGAWFASGSEDNNISLWRTEEGKLLYSFDAEHGVDNPHQGTITALHFTPQAKLVSASRDNTVRIWSLKEKGPQLDGEPLANRSGNVASLGVSQDGRWMLFDRGKSLQIRSLADGLPVNVLENPSGATPFDTLALFSPDASLILTAGISDGRLQLWRSPSETQRGYEGWRYVSADRSAVTCAAFAPNAGTAADGSFAVSGTREGHVLLWPVPNKTTVEQFQLPGTLTLVERFLDASTRQVRIGVDVDNPQGRLKPGQPTTIVINP